MSMWGRLTKPWMTDREYRANSEGLNIVFGATLGFVLAGAEAMSVFGFVAVLVFTISVVVSIIYISASKHRLAYAVYSLVGIALMPWMARVLLGTGFDLPPKLQPTLAVWAVVAAIVEFSPRAKEA